MRNVVVIILLVFVFPLMIATLSPLILKAASLILERLTGKPLMKAPPNASQKPGKLGIR